MNRYDETYTYLGVLNGRFYNNKGEKTELSFNLEKILEKQKHHEKINSEFNARFPTCNSEWTQEKGLTKVWCSTESGGIKRSWVVGYFNNYYYLLFYFYDSFLFVKGIPSKSL